MTHTGVAADQGKGRSAPQKHAARCKERATCKYSTHINKHSMAAWFNRHTAGRGAWLARTHLQRVFADILLHLGQLQGHLQLLAGLAAGHGVGVLEHRLQIGREGKQAGSAVSQEQDGKGRQTPVRCSLCCIHRPSHCHSGRAGTRHGPHPSIHPTTAGYWQQHGLLAFVATGSTTGAGGAATAAALPAASDL